LIPCAARLSVNMRRCLHPNLGLVSWWGSESILSPATSTCLHLSPCRFLTQIFASPSLLGCGGFSSQKVCPYLRCSGTKNIGCLASFSGHALNMSFMDSAIALLSLGSTVCQYCCWKSQYRRDVVR